jgi:hypothetical protein
MSKETIFIRPREGFVVRDPITQRPLAAEGEQKESSIHWLRRLNDGDVVLVSPKTSKKGE